MKMWTCRNCGHAFNGEALLDELGWHAVCPSCGSSFDVYLPEKRFVIATALMPDDEYDLYFTDEFNASGVEELYTYPDFKSLLEGWKRIAAYPPSMWYWVIDVYANRDVVETIVSGAIDHMDEETLRNYFCWRVKAIDQKHEDETVKTNEEEPDFISKLCDSMPREDFLNAILRSKITAMIIQERAKRNMTRKQFGALIDVPEATIRRWEDFDSDFRISALVHICSMLGVIPVLSFKEEGEDL